jgi:predicted alpha/beta hydrolase family esterase
MKAYIFHGTNGTPEENWFPWLKKELNNIRIETEVPQLPNSEHPNLNDWINYVSNLKTDSDTILIGHSLGSVLILRMLEKGYKAKAVYLAAPFLNDLRWDVLKESLFFSNTFDWKLIKERCPKFEVFASKNDPHVSVKDVELVANNLGVVNQVLDVEKHFNIKEFPYLLERIKKNF